MSALGDFGPARPGVDLSKNQNANAFGAISTLITIGTAAVTLRLAARLKTKEGLAVDDYIIFCALVGFRSPLILLFSFSSFHFRQFFSYGTASCALVSKSSALQALCVCHGSNEPGL
jgi:hypothetical protein